MTSAFRREKAHMIEPIVAGASGPRARSSSCDFPRPDHHLRAYALPKARIFHLPLLRSLLLHPPLRHCLHPPLRHCLHPPLRRQLRRLLLRRRVLRWRLLR